MLFIIIIIINGRSTDTLRHHNTYSRDLTNVTVPEKESPQGAS